MPRLSIPVKTLLAGGIGYLAALAASTWAVVHYELDPEALFFFWPLKNLILAGRILFALLFFVAAAYFFLERPLVRLNRAMTKAGEGDFLIRAEKTGRSEVGLLAENFNRMLSQLTDLSVRKVQVDHDLITAREELKYKRQLEEKNRLIASTNRTLENLVRDLTVLYEIGQNINQTVELQPLYDLVCAVLKKHLRLENFSLMIWDERRQILEVKAAFGFEQGPPVEPTGVAGGEGIAGQVLQTGRPVYVPDIQSDPRRVKRGPDVYGCVYAAPLHFKGRTFGVANFGRECPDGFFKHDMKILTLVANQIALAMANAQLYTQTRELSVTDELTGVFNRRHFNQVLQLEWKRAVRFKRELSVLMIDIDFFKKYNDTFGHPKGDEALKKMGRLLDKNLREVDTVARFGGEEFVALLPDTDKRGALAVAEKLRHLVQEQVKCITVSIGVATFPEDVKEMDDLIDHADIALYDAKDQGRNRVYVFKAHRKEPHLKPAGEEKPEADDDSKSRLVH
ncbi:MAG: diguanylate cyclase [Deltaproteobacteria bacterium]|nr:diguanylate cyclase [Deltaproteobacteria bacterium]